MKPGPVPQSCLLVARDATAWRATFDAFAAYGVTLAFADDLASAHTVLHALRPAVALIDAEGLGSDHIPLLRGLVAEAHVPIVALLDPADEVGQIMALEVGATDVVNRAASPRLLLARLNRLTSAVISAIAPPPQLAVGGLRLDADSREARTSDMHLGLTASEFDVLFALASHAERPVSRAAIARALGRDAAMGRAVDMVVCRIRRKLREASVTGVRIRTSYGRGYVLSVEGRTAVADPWPAVAAGARRDAPGGAPGKLFDLAALPA